MCRIVLTTSAALWLVTLYELGGENIAGLSTIQIYILASMNYVVYAISAYHCKQSNRALITLAGLSIASFVANRSLLFPLIPPQNELYAGIFLVWYLMLQAIAGIAAVFVYAYATDESLRYKPETFPNGKILAAAILGLPAIAFLTLVYVCWP
jgi:hypothetical protein